MLRVISILIFFLFGFFAFAQCPTVPTVIELCDSDLPRVSDLLATDNGDGVVWYSLEVGGSPLPQNAILSNMTTYYADDSSGSCSPRQPQLVTIFGAPPSDVNIGVSRCSSDPSTISSLSANGDNIEWYSERTGGVLLSPSTVLEDGETYWVQQTENGCVSARLPTTVTIIDPGPPVGDAEQFFCIDADNPIVYTLENIDVIGDNVTWYNSSTSNTILDPTTPLVADATYYATQTTFPCQSTGRFEVRIRFTNANNPGVDATLDFCDDITGTISLLNELGGSPDSDGVWSGPITTSGNDSGDLDLQLLDVGSYVFTYTLAENNGCPQENSRVTINIQAEPNAGENATLDICSSGQNVDLFTLLGGTPDMGGSWSPTLASGTGIFNPNIDSSGLYTYTVAANAPCTVSNSATITVTVETAQDAGTSTSLSLCNTDDPIDIFDLLGSSAASGGTWMPELISGTNVFDPSVDVSGTYTYSLQDTATCPGDQASIVIDIQQQQNAGIGSSLELCDNDDPVDLFTLLTGNPDAGGSWSPPLSSGTGLLDPGIDAPGSYVYSVGGGACATDTATITVTINPLPNSGLDATLNLCGDSAVVDLFSLLGTDAQNGGEWSGPSTLTNGSLGTFEPTINVSGEYIYTVLGLGACENSSSIVTVNVSNPSPAIEIDDNIFCFTDNPLVSDLLSRIQMDDANGILTVYDSPNDGAIINTTQPLVDNLTYYITERSPETNCESSGRLPVTVSLNNPDVPILSDNLVSFCASLNPSVSDLNSFLITGNNVIWFDADNDFELLESNPLVAGDYYAIEQDDFGCSSSPSAIVSVVINDNPVAVLIPNGNEFCGADNPTLVDLEENLIVEDGLETVWFTSSDGDSTIESGEELINGQEYFVGTLNLITGCISSERLSITVDLTKCEVSRYPLLIPDGFSPNGDGINDFFSFNDVEFLYPNYEIEIFNRQGNIIFKGNANKTPWDGTSNVLNSERQLPNGVYFYIFYYNLNGIEPTQGHVYLNR